MLRAFLRARDGATAVIAAACGAAIIGFGALATDVGYVYLKSRELQGAADLAALAAARDLRNAQALAEATVRANKFGHDVRVEAVIGRYRADPDLPPEQRFRPGGPSPNAVRVLLHSRADLFFGKMFVEEGTMAISRAGVAAETRFAAFEIGSRLLSLDGGVANALLSGLTGSNVSLSVMDYNALLRADVDLFEFIDALRTRLDLEAASYDETLDARADTVEIVEAIADALARKGDPAAEAMRKLARAARPLGQVEDLAELFDLGPYGGQDITLDAASTNVEVNAFDLATAVLELAGGARQVELDLGAQLPGLADVNIRLAIGERPNRSPWIAITDADTIIVRTAQMRLYVDARVASSLAALAQVRIPLVVEAASAQARLSAVSCGRTPAQARVTLDVSPSVGMIALADFDIGAFDDFKRPLALRRAQMVRTSLARVEGAARVDIGGQQWQDVRFSGADIAAGRVKTVQTRDIARASVGSLLSNAHINVQALGLSIGTGPLTSALAPLLSRAAAPLDHVLNGVSDLLGIGLGEADVRVNGVRCDGATLVG